MESNTSNQPIPSRINHVAISVTNLEHAVKWYQKVLGFRLIGGPIEFVTDDSVAGNALKDIHRENLKKMRMSWLLSENHVGLEIVEYIEPRSQRRHNNFEYWKSGITHICITDPKIEELCEKISNQGGKQRSGIWEIVPLKGYKIAFCEDPFGNVIGVYSNSYEEIITFVSGIQGQK
jgi:catechol 2,3-dioxygenase-like lactoylglutathione lyase family enzyme